MPFVSEAQRRYMYANHPKLAKEFETATPENADLPERVKKDSSKKNHDRKRAAMKALLQQENNKGY